MVVSSICCLVFLLLCIFSCNELSSRRIQNDYPDFLEAWISTCAPSAVRGGPMYVTATSARVPRARRPSPWRPYSGSSLNPDCLVDLVISRQDPFPFRNPRHDSEQAFRIRRPHTALRYTKSYGYPWILLHGQDCEDAKLHSSQHLNHTY